MSSLTYHHMLVLGMKRSIKGDYKPLPDRVCSVCRKKLSPDAEDAFDHYYARFEADSGRPIGGIWWCNACFETPIMIPRILLNVLKSIGDDDYKTLNRFGVLLGLWDHNTDADPMVRPEQSIYLRKDADA